MTAGRSYSNHDGVLRPTRLSMRESAPLLPRMIVQAVTRRR